MFSAKSQTKTSECPTTVFISQETIEVYSVNKCVVEIGCKDGTQSAT